MDLSTIVGFHYLVKIVVAIYFIFLLANDIELYKMSYAFVQVSLII